MFALNYQFSTRKGDNRAHLIYNPTNTTADRVLRNDKYTDELYKSCLASLDMVEPSNLIIEQKEHNTWYPSITLPPLSKLTYITNISIRYINIYNNHIPTFPPNLLVLNLYCTSIQVLDNLPDTLKIIVLSTNTKLTHVTLPRALHTFEASYQTKFKTITFPPTISYLRFYQCAFTRLNRLTLDTIQACTFTRPCFIECINPYTDLRINQRTRPYVSQPHLVLDCINQINRAFDEDITSVFYRLRKHIYYSTKIDCPIIKAMGLASNPPRRFSEFIVEI